MEVQAAIKGRHSVRDYTDQPVSEAIVRELLNAAVQAPNAVNVQPWAFTVIQDKDLLKRISDRSKELMLQEALRASESAEFRKMLQSEEFNVFYNAGTLIVIWSKPEGSHPDWDCCLAGENLMLAAREMGLGTCPIGFSWPAFALPEFKRELGVPDAYQAVLPIIVGYPRSFPEGHPRRPPEILSWRAPAQV